ncbi:MAG TPA: thiamine pyrophosphate-dependent enzyme, partial [Burkholderiaceae bacterium]
YMADAYGKLTGEPGIAFCTRGPGATNASIGLHTAYQDSTPMILFIGQVSLDVIDREAFQELDYRRMFGQVAKWVAQIDRADRIPEYVARAFQTATSGRMGPVVLVLPEDMLQEQVELKKLPRYRRTQAWPAAQDMTALANILTQARKPIALLGGTGWTPDACAQFERFAQRWDLPVVTEYRFQDVFDNHHAQYAGEIGPTSSQVLLERVKQADLVLAIGLRLSEGTTRGYTLINAPQPHQRLVHVHPGSEELGSVFRGELLIQASAPAFCAGLEALYTPNGSMAWAGEAAKLHDAYLLHSEPVPAPHARMDLAKVVRTMEQMLPPDAIVTEGAGNYAGWWQRYFRHRGLSSGRRNQLAPSNGSMGYGVPSAVAAKLAYPEATVVSVSGDGCFMMNGQEVATALQHEAPVIFIVVNNGMYGTIRAHQGMHYPGRSVGTILRNPDFAALARAYGAQGFSIERTEEFADAFAAALACGTSALIEIRIDPDTINTRTTLSAIEAKAHASRAPAS